MITNSNTTSWCTDCKINNFTHTWMVKNFSFRKYFNKMESSRFSPPGNDKLKWYYRLDPRACNRNRHYVLFELVVETCAVPVALIIRPMVNNSRVDKKFSEITQIVTQKLEVQCIFTPWDNFFEVDSLTFKVEIVMAEQFRCKEVPSVQIVRTMSRLTDNLTHLLDDREFSDVKIIVRGKEFYAHKAILAVRSPVFRAMFKNEMVESKQNQVTITDIEPEIFAELLRFIYTDSVRDMESIALELLQAADKYDMACLKAMCEYVLCATICEETVTNLLVIADIYRADQLKRATISFIEGNAHVMNSEQWRNFWTLHFDLANRTMIEMLKLRN